MVGTAAEVTPIREIDDQVVGPPGPVTPKIQQAYLDTVHGRSDRWSQWLEFAPAANHQAGVKQEVDSVPLSGPDLGAARGGARPRSDALGPALARADDRPLRGARSPSGSARRTRPRSRPARRAAFAGDHGRHRSGRRGDHVAVLLRCVRELLPLRRRRSGLRRHRPGARSTSTRPRSRPRSPRAQRRSLRVDIYGYPCELDELRAIADRHGLALIERLVRGARSRVRGAPLGSHGRPCVFAFYPNKQMTTGEGGMVTTHSEEEWRVIRSLRNQGRRDRADGSSTCGSASTTA